MKNLKKLFQLLPVFAIAFVSGLSAILSNKRDISPSYADGLIIYDYNDTQNLTYSVRAGNTCTCSMVLSGNSTIIQDMQTGDYYLRYYFDLTDISFYNGSTTYNYNVSYYGRPQTLPPVRFSFTSGLLYDDGSLDYSVVDRDYTLTLLSISCNGMSVNNDGNLGNTYYTFVGVSFRFQYSIQGLIGSNVSSTGTHDIVFGRHASTESYFTNNTGDVLRSSFVLNYEFFSVDYPDRVTAYEQGLLEGYQNGYNEGYNAGQGAGYQQGYGDGGTYGYQNGYSDAESIYEPQIIDAYDEGYSDGYNEGFSADSTATTIFSGILQVGMLPINILLAIFNFEILGINLSVFISAIFTVCLTIIVIKTVKGGKD